MFEFTSVWNFWHRRTRKKVRENIIYVISTIGTHSFRIDHSFQSRSAFFSSKRRSLFHVQRNIRTTVSRTMKLHFRKSNRGPSASSQLHCLYECANNGTIHFLREYILTISNRSRTCLQANTRGSTDMYGSTCRKSTNSRFFFASIQRSYAYWNILIIRILILKKCNFFLFLKKCWADSLFQFFFDKFLFFLFLL